MSIPMPTDPAHELETVRRGLFDWWGVVAIALILLFSGIFLVVMI